MALRTFGSDTLNDNWAEERAKPLRGVLSDFGHREYETTYKSAFPGPRLESRGSSRNGTWSKAIWQQRRADPLANPGRLNMAQSCTVHEAMRDRSTEDRGFGSFFSRTRQTGPPMPCSKEAETTTGAAFGVPKRACRAGNKVLHVPDAPPSGWVEPREDREGASTSGQKPAQRKGRSRPIGERFMEGADPIQSTAAQRSWVYSHDPVIKYHHEGVPVLPTPRGVSLAIGEGPRAATANNKRSRSITLEREPNTERGTSIWIDWHIAPGEA